jgi:hypothetical protein
MRTRIRPVGCGVSAIGWPKLAGTGTAILTWRDTGTTCGHADSKTTLGYIGTMDVEARRAPALIQFDVSGLYEQGRLD